MFYITIQVVLHKLCVIDSVSSNELQKLSSCTRYRNSQQDRYRITEGLISNLNEPKIILTNTGNYMQECAE